MILLQFLDLIIFLLGAGGMIYQVLYFLVGFISKPQTFPDAPEDKHYAILISARDEAQVIGNLIGSLKKQTYPMDLVDIWVVADNCTDDTADVCRSLGCHVLERFNKQEVGKGYALKFLLNHIRDNGFSDIYDAYFIFDADNLLDPHYIEEMNKAFQQGNDAVTSYRNSTNLSENWVSAGSALWFIFQSRLLNSGRSILGNNGWIGGTGFMFSKKIMERNAGWKFHLLTEDVEFTMDCILSGDHIGYCSTAVFYDEQPVSFKQSWQQRVRWSKGFLQVFRYYGLSMIRWAIRERDLSAMDMTLTICPFMVLSVIRFGLGAIYAALGYVSWHSQLANFSTYWVSLVGAIVGFILLAAFICILERKKINATNKELVAYCLSFPWFMLSYVPISFVAMFSKSRWQPIAHTGVASLPPSPSLDQTSADSGKSPHGAGHTMKKK